MLNILRKNAESWIIKLLLGLIIVVFILFFGSSALVGPGQNEAIVAKINGQTLTQKQARGFVRMVKDLNPLYKNLPASYDEQLRQSAIASLIELKLVEQEATKLGLNVHDEELSQTIKQDPATDASPPPFMMLKDPSLWQEGKFDVSRYNEWFRPAYLSVYGSEFEDWVRINLINKKFRELFKNALFVSDHETLSLWRGRQTKVKFKKLTIGSNADNAKQLADELWPQFKKNQLTKKIVEEKKLQESETPWITLASAAELFDGEFDVDQVAELFSLNIKSPFPKAPIVTSGKIYFFKLLDREEPKNGDEQMGPDEKNRLANELSDHFYERWYQATTATANIKIQDPASN